ncbi:MAG: OmpH family outer membrane protein [Deltaproteobacteria bacterium]|nr:OmpH family outer membrane protein [Deltaproteobacteria bacterium]
MFSKATRLVMALVAVLWLSSITEAAPLKIGVVDSGDVVFNSAEGRRVQQILKRKNEELSRNLERRQGALRRMLEDYERQKAIMKDEARRRKEEELSRKGEEFRRQWGASEQEFAKVRDRELKPLFEKFERVINQVAREDGYSLIIDKRGGVLFCDTAIDITDKVRSAFGR